MKNKTIILIALTIFLGLFIFDASFAQCPPDEWDGCLVGHCCSSCGGWGITSNSCSSTHAPAWGRVVWCSASCCWGCSSIRVVYTRECCERYCREGGWWASHGCTDTEIWESGRNYGNDFYGWLSPPDETEEEIFIAHVTDDNRCYCWGDKLADGEDCMYSNYHENSHASCESGYCWEGNYVCCESEHPPGADRDEPCDETGDGIACGYWSCATGEWKCEDDVYEQTYSEGTFTSEFIDSIREVTWTRIQISGTGINTDKTHTGIEYRRNVGAGWSELKYTNTLTPNLPGSRIQIRLTLETDGLVDTPKVSTVTITSTPRLVGSQVSNSFQSVCSEIEMEFDKSIDLSEYTEGEEDEFTEQAQLISFLSQEFQAYFRENNYENNALSIDDMNYCFIPEDNVP